MMMAENYPSGKIRQKESSRERNYPEMMVLPDYCGHLHSRGTGTVARVTGSPCQVIS